MYILPVWASNLAVVAPWCVAVLFAVIYTLKAPWWRTWMGRNLFFFDIAVAVAMTPGFVHAVFGMSEDTEFFQWLLVADLSVVSLLILQRCILLFRVQKGWNWVRAKRHDVPLPDVNAKEMK